jgi:hypothetical protein
MTVMRDEDRRKSFKICVHIEYRSELGRVDFDDQYVENGG